VEREAKKKTRQKTKNLGIIKCCIFIAHSKGEYINGNDEETTTIQCHSSTRSPLSSFLYLSNVLVCFLSQKRIFC
jgi:hypothetical protein